MSACFGFRRKPRLLLQQDSSNLSSCDSRTSDNNAVLSEDALGSSNRKAHCSLSNVNAGISVNGSQGTVLPAIDGSRDQGNNGSTVTTSHNVTSSLSSEAPNAPKLATDKNAAGRLRNSFSSFFARRNGQSHSACRWLFSVCDPLEAADVVESSDDDGQLSPTSIRAAVPHKQKKNPTTSVSAAASSRDYHGRNQNETLTVTFTLQDTSSLQLSDFSVADGSSDQPVAPFQLRSMASCDPNEAVSLVQSQQLHVLEPAVPGSAPVSGELQGLAAEPSRSEIPLVLPDSPRKAAPEAADQAAPVDIQTPSCSRDVASLELPRNGDDSLSANQQPLASTAPSHQAEVPMCCPAQPTDPNVPANVVSQPPAFQPTQPPSQPSERPLPLRPSWASSHLSDDASFADLAASRDSSNVSTTTSSSPDSDCRLSSASMSSALSVDPYRLEKPVSAAVATQAPRPSPRATAVRTPSPAPLPRANTTEALMGTPTVSEDGPLQRSYQSSPFANVHLRHTPQYPRRNSERGTAQLPLTWEERYMLRSQRMYSSGMDGIRNQTYIPDTRNFTEDCAEELFDRILQRRMSLDLQGVGV